MTHDERVTPGATGSDGSDGWPLSRSEPSQEVVLVVRSQPEPDPTDDPPPPAQADALVDAARQTERVRAALARLSPEQAEVVQLSFFDDRPHGEIERALGIPLGTVKSRLRLAMSRLRALLGEAP